ncbi:MAG TPA: hypothetical protein VLB02_02725, partial [Candidatus Paceibacterota bacterium]|nr:hypothetical protein [Candidatus Paceibacterota bacterium]
MKLKHLESVNNNNCLKKLFAFVLFVVLFFAVSQSAEAASRYWVGGTGTWDQSTTTHWSASSGGSGGASVPTASDDVFIDSSSGSGTITVSATAPMLSLDFTGYTGTFAGSAATTISGSLTLGAGMTLTYTGNITFNATSGSRTITSNGKSLASSVTFNGTGGTWAIQDTFVTTQGIVLVAGTLNLNNFNTTSSSFVGTGTGVRTLTMGSGTWTLSGSGIVWDIENASVTPDITFNANTSTIKVTNTSGAVTFRGGSHTYNKLWFSKGADTNSITITGSANTFGELKDDGTAAHSLFFGFNSTTTISTWNISGTPGNLITISSSDGSTGVHLLVKVGSYVDADYLNIQHSAASPVGRWFAGTHSVDNQAVATAGSGWAFTVPDTTAPVIAEVTPVSSPTADATPNYTFSSTEAGTISYGGSCSSATTSAASG